MRDWDKEESIYLWSVAEAGLIYRRTNAIRPSDDHSKSAQEVALSMYEQAQAALNKFYEEKDLSKLF